MNDANAPADVLGRINEIPVSAQLLIQADVACSEAGEFGNAGIATRALALLSILKERHLEGRQISDTFTAITFRLEALERLQAQEHEVLRSWATPSVRGACGIRRQDYFRAAAVEPLVGDGDHPFFEPSGFAQRLLEFSASWGMA